MTEPLPDTWHSRDLLVLRSVVKRHDETMLSVTTEQVANDTGLSDDDIQRAGVALAREGLVDTRGALGRAVLRFSAVSGEARRLSGAWPSADSIADRLIATLEDIAEHGSDEVTRTKARKALDALGGFSRDLLVSVAGAAAGVAMN